MARPALSRAIKFFGTEEPVDKPRTLSAGPLTAVFDNGAIRYIRYHGVEVLRGIAFLVRDKNWGTYAPILARLKVKQSKSGFSISYRATCRDKDQAISYEAKIDANASGTLKFSAVGLPLSDFLTNRTGFVVLHPLAGVVGEPVEIVHTDGKREKSRFPKFISPGQPVFEIRSLKHTVMPGVTAMVLMEGNKFEMEDHRNWMDASYKTYVCSLLDPWPYTLAEGKPFTQSITVTIEGKPAKKPSARGGNAVAVSVGGTKGRLPICGTGVPMKEAQATLDRVDLLAAASPSHLVCQIDGRETRQADAADGFRRLKDKTGIPVRLEIILPAKDSAATEMAKIAEAVRQGGLKPNAVIVTQAHDLKSFQPGAKRPWGPTYEEMAAAARKEFPGVVLGGGMLSFFTELNRKRPPTGLFDFITHTVCPIVHAADDASVMETLESLPSIFASVKAMIGTAPYHIGPSSIPCRDNPYGAAVAANANNGRVCLSDADPRQRGLFAAAWSLGLAARAAEAGVQSIALGSITGAQGAVYRKTGRAQPWYDDADAAVYPVYHVLAGLGRASKASRLATTNSAPSTATALAFRSGKSQSLWLTNLTGEMQTVKVSGFDGGAMMHCLDATSFVKAARDPAFMIGGGKAVKKVGNVELPPYAVALLTSG